MFLFILSLDTNDPYNFCERDNCQPRQPTTIHERNENAGGSGGSEGVHGRLHVRATPVRPGGGTHRGRGGRVGGTDRARGVL